MLLLVEDEAIIAMTVKMALEKFGYAVQTASTGEEAVKVVDTSPEIDLILMDIDLGKSMDGTRTAELILSKHDIPVVFISSHSEPEIVEKTEKITSYGYVVKNSPITVMDASIKMAFKLFDSKLIISRYRTLFEKSNDAIFIVDTATGACLDANTAAEKLTGRSLSVLLTLKTTDLTPLKAGERLDAINDLKDTVIFDDVRYVRPDGSSRIAALTAIPLPGNIAFGIAHDVTEQKRFLEALQESEAKNQVIFEKSVVGMAIVSMSKCFIDCNEAFCSFTGYTPDEMRTKAIADITFPEDLHKGYAEMKEIAAGAIETAIIEKRYVHKSGKIIWGELNIRLIRKEDPSSSYFVASIVDITNRKKAEDTDKLLIAEKEMMLKEVHHRIKNNMSTINALLLLQAGSLQDKDAIRALEEAGNRVRSMELLYEKIYQATNYSELAIGEYLSPLVDDIISNFPNRAALRTEKTFADFAIPVKKLQPLGIIINELLTNIMKYAFAGKSGGTVRISASLEKNLVTLAIQDDGNGMPESVDFEHSTGFGLVLVNGLTRQLGGSIRIERGNGTRIVLEFEK